LIIHHSDPASQAALLFPSFLEIAGHSIAVIDPRGMLAGRTAACRHGT
jgi:hypothetical protein